MNPAFNITLPDGRNYPIIIEAGCLASLGSDVKARAEAKRVIIVTDEHVAAHWLSDVEEQFEKVDIRYDTITLPAGEATKSFSQLEKLLNQLLALQPDRKTLLIALGGGVIGDITGFAASILLRGVPFIQIPTTLLSQVDSSVGGKTGINTVFGKNLVGSFYQPLAVYIDPNTLSTLPRRQMRAGFAEVIKAAAIKDSLFFEWLEENHSAVLSQKIDALRYAIEQSVHIKAQIVMQDEHEKGVRALLNLGHTFGHAFEAQAGYDGSLMHGEAVALGMVMAMDYSSDTQLCASDDADRVADLLAAANLPYRADDVPFEITPQQMLTHFQSDKKTKNGEFTFILSRGIGHAIVEENVNREKLTLFLNDWLGLNR